MDKAILLIAMVLIWIAVLAGAYLRIFKMPKWFANPPASFELIRKQSKNARIFWIPLSILFSISVSMALVMAWPYDDIRNHILASIICFGLTGFLSGVYFVKEVITFTKIPPDSPQTPSLLRRVRLWQRWTTIRNVLQLCSALFLTIAYRHI